MVNVHRFSCCQACQFRVDPDGSLPPACVLIVGADHQGNRVDLLSARCDSPLVRDKRCAIHLAVGRPFRLLAIGHERGRSLARSCGNVRHAQTAQRAPPEGITATAGCPAPSGRRAAQHRRPPQLGAFALSRRNNVAGRADGGGSCTYLGSDARLCPRPRPRRFVSSALPGALSASKSRPRFRAGEAIQR
jgi:hypothetical protein